jgi:hypothetical protein
VIGDIHGHNRVLEAALAGLGYAKLSGVWRHPGGRKVLFLGDLIDRGPQSRGVVATVRAMVEAGEAICLMGNHELNAVHFATEHPELPGQHLRPRIDKNLRQHIAFLQEYHTAQDGPEALAADLAWLRGLPLWLEVDGLRAVHACWSQLHFDRLLPFLDGARILDDTIWQRMATPGDDLMDAVEVVLKGAEIRLPDGVFLTDKDGHRREHARLKWWQGKPTDWAGYVMGPAELIEDLGGRTDRPEIATPVSAPDKPTFFGHYWFSPKKGAPWITTPSACCLDFSVARPGGLLGTYRWDGEEELSAEKLVGFDRDGCCRLAEL